MAAAGAVRTTCPTTTCKTTAKGNDEGKVRSSQCTSARGHFHSHL